MKHKTIQILSFMLLAAWMTVIFLYSAQNADTSTEESGKIVEKVAEIVVEDYNELPAEEKQSVTDSLQISVRTAAHFCEYAVLGVLALAAFSTLKLKKRRAVWISIPFGILYCVTDEIHQIFVPGRTAEWIDIFIDSLGVITGVVLSLLVCFIYKKAVSRIRRRQNK